MGHGHGPTPQEYVLHALAACITAGIATGAAARGIELITVSSTVSADFDVQADAEPDVIDALIASATKYSAVFDMLTSPTVVQVRRTAV